MRKEQINRSILLLCLILAGQINASAQNSDSLKQVSHTISLRTGFIQYKDQLNYGLVFNGVSILGIYTYQQFDSCYKFSLSFKLGFDIFHEIGPGFSINVEPINLFYARNLKPSSNKQFLLGGYYSMNYSWQFYPFLQSGNMSWLTSLEIGPIISFRPFRKHHDLIFTFSNSVFGFISRPNSSLEVYFNSRKFSDFVENAHSNFQAGSFGSFNHTKIKIEMEKFIRNKTSLSYEFDYFGYYQYPKFQRVTHSILIKWNL